MYHTIRYTNGHQYARLDVDDELSSMAWLVRADSCRPSRAHQLTVQMIVRLFASFDVRL